MHIWWEARPMHKKGYEGLFGFDFDGLPSMVRFVFMLLVVPFWGNLGIRTCTTTELSKVLTSCLTAIKAKVVKY